MVKYSKTDLETLKIIKLYIFFKDNNEMEAFVKWKD